MDDYYYLDELFLPEKMDYRMLLSFSASLHKPPNGSSAAKPSHLKTALSPARSSKTT